MKKNMKPSLASAPESRDRKCFLEHLVPGKPRSACLEVAGGWSESLPGHLSISKQSHPLVLAQFLLLLLPGCSKEFTLQGKTPPCAAPGAPLLPLPHSTHILPGSLNCSPVLPRSSSALLSYRRQLGPALGALYHSSHEQLFLAPLSFPGSRRDCLLNSNGEKPPLLRTGHRGTFHHTALANCTSAQTLLLDPALFRRAPNRCIPAHGGCLPGN